MALDHYVSQVHLRQFYSQALGNRLYAIRKTDMKAFTPRSEDVCRIPEGSTNAYVQDPRAIEEFLRTIEPKYTNALDKLRTGAVDQECVYAIAGFVSYVSACSPAAMRLQSGPLRSQVETVAAMMDARGALPPSPPQLGGASLTDLIRKGTIEIAIDPKYPQAIGIQAIVGMTSMFGNFTWEVLPNDEEDRHFFTSDFPVAIERAGDPRLVNRIIPLAPDLALRIRPDLSFDRNQADLSFKRFRYQRRRPSRNELAELNRLIVRCAEELVFYRDDHPWVQRFVSKNRAYRVEPHTDTIPTPTGGTFLLSTYRVAARRAPLAPKS